MSVLVLWNDYLFSHQCLILFGVLVLAHEVSECPLLLLLSKLVLELELWIDLLFAERGVRFLEIHIVNTSVFSLRGLLRFKRLSLLNMVIDDF